MGCPSSPGLKGWRCRIRSKEYASGGTGQHDSEHTCRRRRVPPEIAAGIAEHVADDTLTEHEIEVLRKAAAGTSNKMIASQLAISEATVKTHMKSILSKLGANDRTHAVTIAMKRGFIDG